jgi:integrase/recombinase XerD
MLMAEIERYVAMYRKFVLNYKEVSWALLLFTSYAEGFGDAHVRVSRLRDLCLSPSSPVRARSAYDAVRRLCVFTSAEGNRHEVPPAGAFGHGKRRRPTPYIFELSQITAI